MKKYIAYCGLDCESCEARLATLNDDNAIRNKLCPIRQCALSRIVETCGNCIEMNTCEKLAMITGNNAEALERLKG